ncbi:MAG: hypothetical protein WA633_05895 [Stellaceae bacterium]
MRALAILETGLMLGLYTLLAGAWGVLYTLGHLRKMPIFWRSAAAAYGLHVLTVLIILGMPLGTGWKCLIVGSSLVFLAIPPMTWRFLQYTHRDGRSA